MWDGGPPRSAAGRTTVFPLRVLQVNHSCDYCYPGLTQSITHRLTWTSCADTHHLWAGNNTTRRLCKDICAFCKTKNDRDEVVPFSLALSLQKWKPKGTALQHMVSGLCLDSQTPTGPLVITQCRPQVASQSWEPQIITWATADGGGRGRGRKREEQDLDPACRKTLGVGEGRGITSAHCLTPRRGVEGVRTVLLWCQLQALLLIASRWQERRRKRYEASSRAFCVQCFIPLEDAAVLLRNLSFSLKTVAHLTFHFLSLSWSTICLIIGVASLETTLKECILYCSKCVEVHLTYSEFKSHCLSCGLVLGWGMSDDGVDQGSFMYSQLKSQLFFFFFYCWKAVLKAPCKALSGTLFIVLHGQTQRMFVFFFCLSTKFYVNIRSRYWLGFGVKYSICCLKNKMW